MKANNMHSAKRKRGDLSPSLTPPPFSSATPAETDSRPSTLSPEPEDYSPELAKIFEDCDHWRSFTDCERVTKDEVQKMRSFREIPAALAARDRQAHIHANTRRMMRVCTRRMVAIASRDYQRPHHVPTKRTNPSLHKRRYSIEVHKGFDKDRTKRVSQHQHCTCGREDLHASA